MLRDNWPYMLLPAIGIIVGGGVAAWRTIGAGTRSLAQHLAAGSVFAAVAVELLPDVVAAHRPFATAIGFAIGTALMLAIRWKTTGIASEPPGAAAAAESAGGLLGAVGVDIAIDGLLIGVGFTAGESEGVLLTIALTLEVIFLALATTATLAGIGYARPRALAATGALAVTLLVAAVAGATLLSRLSDAPLEVTLAFGVAALLYLVTEELLVEAHETTETAATTATFFVGFLAVLIVEMLR